MKLTTRHYPVPRLIMSGAIPHLHLRLHVTHTHNFIFYVYLEEKMLPVRLFLQSEEHRSQQNVCLWDTPYVEAMTILHIAKLMITKPTRNNSGNIWMFGGGGGVDIALWFSREFPGIRLHDPTEAAEYVISVAARIGFRARSVSCLFKHRHQQTKTKVT
jgi:hypothetical protein